MVAVSVPSELSDGSVWGTGADMASGTCTVCAKTVELTPRRGLVSAHRDGRRADGAKCLGSGRSPGPAKAKGSLCGVCRATVESGADGRMLSHYAAGRQCPGGGRKVKPLGGASLEGSTRVTRVGTDEVASSFSMTCSACRRVEFHSGPWRGGVEMGPHTNMRKVGTSGPQCPGAGRPPGAVMENTRASSMVSGTAAAVIVLVGLALGGFLLFKVGSWLSSDDRGGGGRDPECAEILDYLRDNPYDSNADDFERDYSLRGC